MGIAFEKLQPNMRDIEYKRYKTSQKSKVVYGYLFKGLSHRALDKKYLFLDSENSLGYQSMGVLHHLGIIGAHKNIFSQTSLADAINILEGYDDKKYDLIAEYLKQYASENIVLLNTKKQKYVSEIIEALNYYGGEASLNDIYDFIQSKFGFDLPDDVMKSSIRKAIYNHSSDADLYEGKNDLFYSIKGKGYGIWGNRTYTPNENAVELTEDDASFPEGKQFLRKHIIRERNPKVIREAKKRYKQKNKKISCQICNFNFEEAYGTIGEDYIEGHHIKPISDIDGENLTCIEDIALLCSNCHKMIHRKRPWLSMEELKTLIK